MNHKFLTVVIQLPDDINQCNAITEQFKVSDEFLGGTVTAISLEDEITVNELLEEQLDSDLVAATRKKAKEF